MFRFGLGLMLLGVTAWAGAAGRPPVRIPVRHADPWMVKAFFEGMAIRQPELSTNPGFTGLGQAAANGASSFLKGGRLVVNPTDNSLWFFPDDASKPDLP